MYGQTDRQTAEVEVLFGTLKTIRTSLYHFNNFLLSDSLYHYNSQAEHSLSPLSYIKIVLRASRFNYCIFTVTL